MSKKLQARIKSAKLSITPKGFSLQLEVEFSKKDVSGGFAPIINDPQELIEFLSKAGIENTDQLDQLVGLSCWTSIKKDDVYVMGLCEFHGLIEPIPT